MEVKVKVEVLGIVTVAPDSVYTGDVIVAVVVRDAIVLVVVVVVPLEVV